MKRRATAGALLLAVIAFALRLAYLLHSHPFFDEFSTILAAQTILQHGLPVLPSGLFYEHGLVFSYLDAPFVALSGQDNLFILARLPSLLLGTMTVLLLYKVGRQWLSPRAGLIAAALLAFSPEGMVWGGRARMYALAQLLVLLLIYLVYEGSRWHQEGASRRAALVVLLAALLTQLGVLILVPPLLAGALVVGWLTRRAGVRPWFLRPAGWLEAVVLGVVVGLGILVKRLGQPLGADPLAGGSAGDLAGELIGTVTYQASLVLDGESAIKYLAREFGVPHHLWLTLVAVVGGVLALAAWANQRKLTSREVDGCQGGFVARAPKILLYLWIVLGLTVVEMVTLLEPWRRNPRYLVIALPLFYLVVAAGVEQIASLISVKLRTSRLRSQPFSTRPRGGLGDRSPLGRGDLSANHSPSIPLGVLETGPCCGKPTYRPATVGLALPVLVFATVQAVLLLPDLRVAYLTPEPAYEEAFRHVAGQWQPGDVVLTMNTSAAGLILGQVADLSGDAMRFAVQEDADQFLLNDGVRPVDRWLGAPWVGTSAEFNRVLNRHARVWFVIDTIRLPVYYRGDWLSILGSQMDLLWSLDNALVYLSRPDRTPVPAAPDVSLDVRFGDVIVLKGYSLARKDAHPIGGADCNAVDVLCLAPGNGVQITLFWQALKAVDGDYTVFVHLRNEEGATPTQRDVQPFDGLYPTSRWQPGDVVVQPVDMDLPPDLPAGTYKWYVGLYRLETMARLPLQHDASGENAVIFDQVVRVISDQ